MLVLLFGGRWVALRYTEHAWFAELGQGARFNALFLRSVLWQLAVFGAALAWYAGHTLGLYRSIGSVHLPRRLGNLEIDEAVPSRTLRNVALGVAALLAAATAYTFSDLGDYVALARAAAPLGLTEPVLHQDASYYLATLPLLEILHLLASISVLLACLLVVGLYVLTGSLSVSRRHVRITPHARAHVVVLLVSLALMLAWGFHLDTYEIVGGGGALNGALTGVDRAIRIPATSALAVIALVVAVGSALAHRWVRPWLVMILWATLAVAALLGRLVIPVLADAWGGGSNPALQQELLQRSDEFSRAGFGLTGLPARPVGAAEVADSAAAIEEALAGVYGGVGEPEIAGRLLGASAGDTSSTREWTLSPAFAVAGGRARPAALAVSQTDLLALMRQLPRPRWTPLHREALAWGGGPFATLAGLRAGAPRFLASLDPIDSAPPGTALRGIRGRIRFLPRAAELAVVGPEEAASGEPTPGVLLSGFPRRLLLAWALQSPPLLDDHTASTDRVLYWRDVPTRLGRLYSFAGFDPARAALVGGRLLWIADGYALSGRFPLSQHISWRTEEINYLDAPYVATVDASSGETRLYMRPGAGAFARSVATSSLVEPLPADSLGPALRRALHYPTGLLGAQAAMLARLGPSVVPGGASSWVVWAADTGAIGRDAALVHPTFALLALESARVRLWQIVPLADTHGNRLAGLLAASGSESGESELRLLQPRGAAALSPATAATRMGALPVMALTAGTAGPEGAPQRGQTLVVPAAGTIVYAQALYTTPDRASQPLRTAAIIVLAGARVGIGADVPAAVRSLLHGDAERTGVPMTGGELAEARAAFLRLDSASQARDWDRFARAWAELRRALRAESVPGARP